MKYENAVFKAGALLFYMLVCAGGLLLAFSSGPLPGRTGDFGEPNCTECHSTNTLNSPGGSLTITGVPAHYNPGQTYPITVTLARSGQRRWGFELAVRFVTGGAQAGTLAVTDSARTQIVAQNGIQYVEHTSAGTSQGAAQGSWTFNWKAPDAAAGTIRFSTAGNAANGDGTNFGDFINTATATTTAAEALPVSAVFAHIAAGGGYSTIFTLTNTGADALTGNLILTASDGSPLEATLSSPTSSIAGVATSAPLTIPPGGTQIITATSDPTQTVTGWARVESSGGQVHGVATFQLRDNSGLQTVVGVLSSNTQSVVTIPVNDDSSRLQFTGYAIANPGASAVSVSILLVDSNGVVVNTLSQAHTLDPGKQIARFLSQDFNDPNFTFRGSAVFQSDTGAPFAAVALVQVTDPRLLFTAIPVTSGKAPNIGN